MDEEFPPRFGWHQPHHWYWGVIMSTIGFIMLFEVHGWWYMIPILIGIHWMLDDVWQHTRQSRDFLWWKRDDNYTSWVHKTYWKLMCWLRDHTSGWVNSFIRLIMRY